jgi:tetratricopeptide (TPR) repeat protein
MQNLGEYEEALKIHFLTIKIAEELFSKDHCEEIYLPILQMNLKYTFELGSIFYNMGRFLEAKSCYEMNLIVLYKLLKTYPENSNYQSYTAGTFNNLGTLLADMGRIEEAKNAQEKSLLIYEKLLSTDPENIEQQSHIAMILNNLGVLLSKMDLLEEAKQRYVKALEMRERLLEIDPKNTSYQSQYFTNWIGKSSSFIPNSKYFSVKWLKS